jgi:signal transduction histidine kinase
MGRGWLRRKYIISKGIRYVTTALLVILSSLTLFFIFLTGKLSDKVEPGFFIVMIPYALIVLCGLTVISLLVVLFTHRIAGPFERLGREMDLIQQGDYTKRLRVRDNDDKHLKLLLAKFNNVLDKYEQIQSSKIDLLTELDNELSEITDKGKDTDNSKDNNNILLLHNKVRSMLMDKKADPDGNTAE